jgi:hypothetical protein
VGTVFGLRASSKSDEAARHCDGAACDPPGVPLRDDARAAANVSTVAFAAGGVALAVGAIVFLTAPRAPPRVSVGGACLGAGCGVFAQGRF